MKVLVNKKNYLAQVPFYLFLLLWHTSKLALVQTYKYAPRLMKVPRYQNIGKPWKKVKEAASKVIRNRNIMWQLRPTDYQHLSSICRQCLMIPGWKQLYRYSQLLAAWDKRLLIRIRENISRHGKKKFGISLQNRQNMNEYYRRAVMQSYGIVNREVFNEWHYNTKLKLYKKMPLRMISRLWGHINSLELPHWLRRPTFNLYTWIFNCQAQEAIVQDFTKYKNLSEFFRRMLKPGIRPIAKTLLTSPADGRVLHCGKVQNGTLEQVKGVTYSLHGFLGSLDGFDERPNFKKELKQIKNSTSSDIRKECNADDYSCNGKDGDKLSDVTKSETVNEKLVTNLKLYQQMDQTHSTKLSTNHSQLSSNRLPLLTDPTLNRLFYCVIYLAPGDYHRFHSPADWHVQKRRHFPGELFSVKPSVARWLRGLFSMNERVVYFGRWVHGFFSMTPVGATNVGSISVYIDKSLKTNVYNKSKTPIHHDKCFINNSCDGLIPKSSKCENITSTVVDGGMEDLKSLDGCNEVKTSVNEDFKKRDLTINSNDEAMDDIKDDNETSANTNDDEKAKVDWDDSQKQYGIYLKKGKLFGEFNLGSTIVLLFEAPRNFKFAVTPGQKVQYGQAISVY